MIEQRILEASNNISRGVVIRSELRAKATDAKRVYDVAYALAFKEAQGSMEVRKQEAVLATCKEREAYENAELVYKHAETTAKSLEQELSALQSIASSIRETFRTAGVGER